MEDGWRAVLTLAGVWELQNITSMVNALNDFKAWVDGSASTKGVAPLTLGQATEFTPLVQAFTGGMVAQNPADYTGGSGSWSLSGQAVAPSSSLALEPKEGMEFRLGQVSPAWMLSDYEFHMTADDYIESDELGSFRPVPACVGFAAGQTCNSGSAAGGSYYEISDGSGGAYLVIDNARAGYGSQLVSSIVVDVWNESGEDNTLTWGPPVPTSSDGAGWALAASGVGLTVLAAPSYPTVPSGGIEARADTGIAIPSAPAELDGISSGVLAGANPYVTATGDTAAGFDGNAVPSAPAAPAGVLAAVEAIPAVIAALPSEIANEFLPTPADMTALETSGRIWRLRWSQWFRFAILRS